MKKSSCVYHRGYQWIDFWLVVLSLLGSFDTFVIIKQDATTSCHPLVSNHESHKPPKEQPEHWGGSLIDLFLSLSLLYFVFTLSYIPCTEKQHICQKTKTQNPMKIHFPLSQQTVQINHRQKCIEHREQITYTSVVI